MSFGRTRQRLRWRGEHRGADCGLSAPGEVLVSETVRSLARTSAGVRFEDRGEQALKGVGEAVRVWAVLRGPQDERAQRQGTGEQGEGS